MVVLEALALGAVAGRPVRLFIQTALRRAGSLRPPPARHVSPAGGAQWFVSFWTKLLL